MILIYQTISTSNFGTVLFYTVPFVPFSLKVVHCSLEL